MFGDLTTGELRCYTLEDELRQVKRDGETAIPASRYGVIMEYSPTFGRDLLTLLDVRGFDKIRIHSVRDDDDTEGCIGVGNRIDEAKGTISGGLNAGIEDKLEAIYEAAAAREERVWLTIINAPGDRYVDSNELAGGEVA
jgi:hypothetical protein